MPPAGCLSGERPIGPAGGVWRTTAGRTAHRAPCQSGGVLARRRIDRMADRSVVPKP